MIGEVITVIRPGSPTGGFDEQGNPIMSDPTSFTIDGVAPAPGTRDEQQELYGPRSTEAFTLYRRGPLDLRSDDTVTFRGIPGWQVVAGSLASELVPGDDTLPDADEEPGLRPVDMWVSPYSTLPAGSVVEIRKGS